MGIYIGSGLAFIIGGSVDEAVQGAQVMMPMLGEVAGWQATFIIVGLPGLLVALLMLTVREPARRGIKQAGSDGKPSSIPDWHTSQHRPKPTVPSAAVTG